MTPQKEKNGIAMTPKDKESIKNKILTESGFVYCPRLGNSIKRLLEKNPNGISDDRIKKVLLMNTQELEGRFNNAIKKLRKALGIK